MKSIYRLVLAGIALSTLSFFLIALARHESGVTRPGRSVASAQSDNLQIRSLAIDAHTHTKDLSDLTTAHPAIEPALSMREDIRHGRIRILVANGATRAVLKKLRVDSNGGDLVAAVELEASVANCLATVYSNEGELRQQLVEQAVSPCWSAFGDDIRSERDLEELRLELVEKFVVAGIPNSVIDYSMLAKKYLEDHDSGADLSTNSADIRALATRYLVDAAAKRDKDAAIMLSQAYSSGWFGIKDSNLSAKFADFASKL